MPETPDINRNNNPFPSLTPEESEKVLGKLSKSMRLGDNGFKSYYIYPTYDLRSANNRTPYQIEMNIPRKSADNIYDELGRKIPVLLFSVNSDGKIIVYENIQPDNADNEMQGMIEHLHKNIPYLGLEQFDLQSIQESSCPPSYSKMSAYSLSWSYIQTIIAPRYGVSPKKLDNLPVLDMALGINPDAPCSFYVEKSEDLQFLGVNNSDFNLTFPMIVSDSNADDRGKKIFDLVCAYTVHIERQLGVCLPKLYTIASDKDKVRFVKECIDDADEKIAHVEQMLAMRHMGMDEHEILNAFVPCGEISEIRELYWNLIKVSLQSYEGYKHEICSKYSEVEKSISKMRETTASNFYEKYKVAQKYLDTTIEYRDWWNDAVGYNGIFYGRGNSVMEGVRDEKSNTPAPSDVSPKEEEFVSDFYPEPDMTYEEMLSRDHDAHEMYYLSMEELLGQGRKGDYI